MPYFPAKHSILSDTHLCTFLEEKYFSENQIKCKLIKTWVNDTYLITNGLERFIFRVYRIGWRSKIEVQAELNIILLLHKNGVSVSFPIKDKNNEIIQTFEAIEGKRFGVLFSFAKGDKPKNNSVELEVATGAFMAQIHRYTNELKIPRIEYSPQTMLDDSIERIGLNLSNDSQEFLFLKKIQQYFYKEKEKMNLEGFRKGVVHFDVWRDNMHVVSNNKITLFDFDFCGNGWLVLDLAYHMAVVFITEPNVQKYEEEMEGFFKGYENILTIKKDERDAIPLLATCTLVYYLSFQSERFAAVYANEDYIKMFINQRIKRWIDFANLPIESIDIS